MSETAQGSGWWQASDGKWYPPQDHPNFNALNQPPQPAGQTQVPQYHFAQAPQPGPGPRRKPWWRRWWAIALWAFLGLVVVSAVASGANDANTKESSSPQPSAVATTEAEDTIEAPDEEESAAPATVAEAPSEEESAAPATTSAAAEEEFTPSQQNAIRSAKSYLEFTSFSRSGLIDQLSSEYGDQFPVDDATIAVDSLDVDWNAQAVKAARTYLDFQSFSCQGLIDQLSSEYGDQYTVEQATFGANEAGIC